MNDKFFPELARCLQKRGITTGPVENNCLPVLSSGQTVMWVDAEGYIVLTIAAVDDPQADHIYETVKRFSFPVLISCRSSLNIERTLSSPVMLYARKGI